MQSGSSSGPENDLRTEPSRRQSSADKTLEILLALGELGLHSGGTVRLTDLVEHTGHPRPTVHRLLGELKRFGFATQDESSGRYSLGPKLLLLSAQCLGGLDLRRVAQPLLQDLVDRIGHTAHLGIRDREWVVFIDKTEATHGVRIASTIGQRREVSATALGKALLAYAPDRAIQEVVDVGLPARTVHSIVDPDLFRADLARTRERGYALDDEECDLGIRCVAAPIFDHAGSVIAAISMTTLLSLVPTDEIPSIASDVISTANSVTRELGGIPRR